MSQTKRRAIAKRKQWLLSPDTRRRELELQELGRDDPIISDPTPDQIAEACADFQAGWTDAQRAARVGGRTDAYEVPEVITGGSRRIEANINQSN